MKLTRSESPAAKGPTVNRTRSTSEITEGSTADEKQQEGINEHWKSYYTKIKVQIRQGLRNQKQRKIDQNIIRFEAWDLKSEKLETGVVPSTL